MISCSCDQCEIKSIFFDTISSKSLDFYCAARKELLVEKGTRFIKQGDQIKEFKYLKSGLVKLHKTDSHNREQIISFGNPMDFVNIHNIFGNDVYDYSITALEPSTICSFDIKIIKDLVQTNGAFALKLINTISQSANRIISDSLKIRNHSLYGKVAAVLLFFADHIYVSSEYELPISRKEIAQYTGLSIETVIRSISEFRRDGLIKVFGKRIEIIDKEGLELIYENS